MTTISSVILIDKRIQHHETIVGAIKADGVRAIVFDVADIDAQASASSFQYILDKIAELGSGSFSNIGIVQHNTGAPFHRFFAESQGEVSTIAGVETADPTLQTWVGFAAFITTLKTTYGVQNVDLMACALYSDPNWKYVIDTLAAQTGVTIRASTDDTGAAALGGDWFLESHTGVNLKDVYFTEAIEDFRGVLYYTNRYDSRAYTIKSFAPGSAFAWGSDSYGGDTSNNITGGSLSSNIIAVYGNSQAMAALRTGGSVVTWGNNVYGATQQKWNGVGSLNPSVADSLTSGVTKLYMSSNAMSALKTDGTVVTWGSSAGGGISSTVTLTNVVDVYPGRYAFAALKSNGSLVTWGGAGYGSDSSAIASSISSNVVSVNMAYRAGAALKKNGSVITWGDATYGGNSSSVTSDLSSGVVVVYTADEYSYAALNNNGRVITWGYSTNFILSSSVNLTNTVSVFSNTNGGYAALKLDGSVVTWGNTPYGGDSTGKGLSTAKVVSIYGSKNYAFAALTSTGNVITWGYATYGGNSSAVSASLTNVVAIYSNGFAFAALKNNGQVITWGDAERGGTSTSVSNDISANVVAVYSTAAAFAALRKDGRVIVWGSAINGGAFNVALAAGGTKAVLGGDLNSGITSITNTENNAFASIQNTTATTFDLSASYYTDNDRYDILRNKENRRRVNLTTLNNNVFTLSSARDIERFNYTIPSGVGPFRIIVPDFVDSNYSITSTASIPGGASIHYIVACEEGEPVTISGTTYINYGAFVYRRNADNTFTKMPSVTIDGLTYNAYGGDGINSSGIALRYRFGAFAIPEKTFGDASFNLTAPVSDSSGAITFTSSNTGVATVTSGGEVTIVRSGTTTITATQAASGIWPADSVSTPLVVNKIVSTLGELTVPAKRPTDVPFTLTTPTSTASSVISPITTITNQLSIITPPTLDVSAVIYGNTWSLHGQEITNLTGSEKVCLSANGRVMIIGAAGYNTGTGYVTVYDLSGTTWVPRGSTLYGTATYEYFGNGVSISANGNIIAVGATGKLTYMGQVRIYAWSGTSWVQRGGDINGETNGDQSGVSVSLSADGTIVAIGASYNSGNQVSACGHVRVYKYTPSKIVDISNQTDPSFGPIGWTRMGADIDGEAASNYSGYSLSLSADGTTVAIGAYENDGSGNISSDNRGHVRVYRYTPDKLVDISNQSDISFGPVGWRRLGQDIDGEGAGDRSSGITGLSLSMYGTTVAIGARYNDGVTGGDSGHVRVYDLSDNSWVKRGQDIDGEAAGDYSGTSVSISADANTLIIGAFTNDAATAGVSDSNRGHARIYIWNRTTSQWQQSGTDIDGASLGEYCGWSVSISADGTTAAVLSSGTRVRVFKRAVSNEIVYTSNNTNVADACGNLLIIKGVDGVCGITSTQNGNVINGRLDVSGTTYTLQYNHITYTSSNTSVATITPFGTVTIYNVGTTTFTATQPETWNYASRSVSGILDVSKISSTLGALMVPARSIFEPSVFTLTAPTSTVSSIISPTHTITSTTSVMIPPPDVNPPVYGTTWTQVGSSIIGETAGDHSGRSVSMSADGTVVAIGAPHNDGNGGGPTAERGHVRVYVLVSGSWYQRGGDIDGQVDGDAAGYINSVSLSADGDYVAVGAYSNDSSGRVNSGSVRVYRYNSSKNYTQQNNFAPTTTDHGPIGWSRIGADIYGEAESDYSGMSVRLSADGTIVAIGAYGNNGANNLSDCGHVRVYKYTPTKLVDISNQTDPSFGPIGWTRMGADIDGEYVGIYSGFTVALSSDGTTVAIGEPYADISSNTADNRGRIRVYRYNALKTTPQLTNPALPTFGPVGWDRIGDDIYGEAGGDLAGYDSISISANGNTVAIGAPRNDGTTGNVNDNRGHTRIYDLSGNTWVQRGQDIDGEATGDDSGTSVSLSADGNIVAIGAPDNRTNSTNTGRGHVRIYYWNDVVNLWVQFGTDIDGPTDGVGSGSNRSYSGYSVSLSSDGTTVAIGAPYDGADPTDSHKGYVRVYRIPVFNKITYTSSNTSVARILNNLLLIGSINGTITITATTTNSDKIYKYNTVTARLDVSGTTYTLQYNPITYTSGNTSVATVSTYGTVTRNTIGTTTFTAFQPETLNYASQVVSSELVVYKEVSTLGALTVPAKIPSDGPFTLTAPTSTISSIISPVNTITSTVSVITPPPDILDISYGTAWMPLGQEIIGESNGDYSGFSVSMSANGRVVAIGAIYNDGTTGVSTDNRGHVRVYDLNGTTWVLRGESIVGEAAGDQSGYSVSLSADGNIVAIGASFNDGSASNAGHVRVYRSTPGKPAVTLQTDSSFGPLGWTRLGGDIDGEAAGDYSGWSVSLSADGTIVAIGGYANDANDSGHVRVYRYTPTKTQAVTNQSDISFGPVGWNRLGGDIDGITGTQSGMSLALSADGTIVAIGGPYADLSSNTSDNRGVVRVYRYNALKTSPQLTDSNVTTFGPAGWDRIGNDIFGEAANDLSAYYSISLSANGNTVAIGSHQNAGPGSGTNNYGSVRIYDLSTNNTWIKRGQDIDGESIGDQSGFAVSISSDGNIVAIGAPYNNGTDGTDTTRGHVRIYFWNGSLWVKRGQDIDGLGSDVRSGSSVCLSSDGSIVAVGGPYNASGGAQRGHVRVYDISVNNALTYTSNNSSIADICANLLLIKGVSGTSTITATQAGNTITARLDVSGTTYTLQYNPFTYTIGFPTVSTPPVSSITSTISLIVPPVGYQDISYGTTWIQRGQDLDGEAADDYFGTSVSFSADGRTLAVGGYLNDGSVAASSIGHVRVFVLSDNTWVQRGSDIDGLLSGDRSGNSVSLSADGTIIAIGAYQSDGLNGADTGKVRVYSWNGSSWIRRGGDIDGERSYDESARSVALSADGNIVAIGARYNDGSGNLLSNSGHVRVYRYNALKLTSQLTDQSLSTFGPVGWDRIGLDIDGEATDDYSGTSLSISADGTVVAIGAYSNDGITGNVNDNRGHVRVYSWNGISWTQLGQDIDGEAAGDNSGSGGILDQSLIGNSVCLSADGRTVAIGAPKNNGASGSTRGHVRVYDLSGNTWIQRGQDIDGEANGDNSGTSVRLSSDGTIVAIGAPYNDGSSWAGHVRVYAWNRTSWVQIGQDINGELGDDRSCTVGLSADGTRVAVGAFLNDGTVSGSNRGHVRVYDISAINAITYSNSNSRIADLYSNILIIKGVNGTGIITASQNDNIVSGTLNVSGTTYTFQYEPFNYIISDTSLATISTYGTITPSGIIETRTITATQPATLNYATRSVSGTLDVSGTNTVLGALTIPTKMFGDPSFNITPPTTNNPSGAFTYTSSNTTVATITSNGVITITGLGTTTITATQALSGIYTAASVSGLMDISAIRLLPTETALVIPTPVSNVPTTYGSLWNQLGSDIVGKVSGDESGTSVSVSADGTIVAIGARSNTTNRGTVRVYKYNDVSWNQVGSDINGEASSDYSGQSVSLSANGRVLAIGANMNDGSGNLLPDSGHVRIYEFNGTNWVQRGGDIDGEANGDQSGFSVSLSADGSTVAIGAFLNDGSGNALSNSGHVRVYRYNASKSVPQLTDQSISTFGPAGWDRLGGDIDGEAVNDQRGFSVSLSANGSVVAIGAIFNDGTSGTVDTSNNRGHVRVYRYNAAKTSPQLTDQTLSTFGPVGWDRMGSDIDGEAAADQSGFSVSLSSNGAVLAIGSPFYDVSGVSNSGRVRVFGWNGSSWAQRGQNINGINLNENMGDSVSLSADGSILSVSSFMKVVNYNYNSSTNTWNQIGANVTGSAVSGQTSITNSTLYSPHVYLDATNSTSYNRTTNTWTNIGSLGGNVVMTYMGTFDASDNGGSFNFNGSGNRGQITVPSTTLTSLTYVAVVKRTGLNAGTIIEFGSDNLLFWTSGNILQLYGPSSSSGFTLTAGVWYVVAVSITTGGTITFYVNGVSVFTTTITSINSTNTVYGIGSGIGGNEYWNGKIAALAIYHNRVLTASEIANVSINLQTYRVNLSSIGNILAIGAREYHGTVGTSTNIGVARVYRIDTSGNYTYSINNTAIADICGNILLPKSIGTTTIGFTQSASGATASRSGTINLTVSAITPTIGTLSAPAKNFSDASFNLTAPTSNSSGAFTYTSSNTAVATVTSGGTVTIVGAGTTTITTTQAATTNYASGSVTASLVVSPIAPTIGALSAPAKNFGDVSFNLTAPSSNSDGAFTYASSVPGVATVTSGGMVTIIGAGSTTITATQASTTNYLDGSVTASLVVSPIAPTIGTLTAPAKNFGDAAFDLTAPTSNSDGAFTYESSDAAVATVTSGGTVTVVGAGSTTITATQASTTNYTGGSVTASLVVSAIAPTIGNLSVPAKNFGDASFNLTAPTSNSDGAFTYTSSAPGVATVTSGGTVTVVGAGSTTITATQAASADGNYTGGSSVTASLVVSPITPTYSSISQITKTYSTDVSFSLTSVMSGVSNSDGAYTFSSTSDAIDICGGVATILAYTPSAITITATQAASGNYNGAGSTTFALLVNRKVPSYGAFSVPAATYEDVPFSIAPYAPTTDSTGVPFTYTSSEPTVATINSDGTVITIIGQGYTTITASQAAGGNYAASSTTTSFLVNRAAPTFLKAFTITNKTFGDASFSLLPFTEGLDNTDGTYHFTSSNAQLVSISEVDGVTATILAYTPTPITIYVAIDACGNYAASSTSGTLTVLRAIPTFGAFTVPAKNFRDASFNLTAPTSDSSGTFTYTSSDAAVATVTSDGGVVTIVGAGSTTITATQEINGNYTTRDISASLVVSPIAPTIGTLTAPAKNFGDASFNLTAPTSDSSGAFTYTSSAPAVATVTSSGTVTIVGVGTTTITATQAASADGNYTTGSVTASLVVSASLSNFTVPAKTYGDASFNLVDPETTDNTVGFTFASSNTSVATLSGRTVTIVGAGSSIITASQAATANRGELTISSNLVVSKAQPVITIAAITKSYGNPSFRPVPTTTNTDTSGGSVFTFSSNNIAVVSMLDATLVRINGIGTATLSITQAASANFTNATSSVVVTVNKGISGFSASTFALEANKTFGDAAFAITTKPISSSTGAITYSSSDEAVATIRSDGSGNSAITLVGQGTVTFTASQVESALYTADTKTSNTLTVARKTAALSRDTPSTDTITKYYGDANFSVSATNESNGAFSYSSSDPSFATINASTGVVTIVAVGSSTLTAARAQTAQYNEASVSWTLNIARGTTTLTGLSSLTRNVTVAPFSVSASSASNGAVSYALQDATSTVLTIHPTSGRVRLLSPGSAVIVASQAQGTFYEAPTSITATITVSPAGTTLEGGTLTGTDDYENVDLSGASLANATITNTNFTSSNLENSNFNNSNVSNTDMSNVDLSGSTMRNATMSNVDFTNANLQGTDLSGTNVRGSIFHNANLSGSTLVRLDASGASFVNADLRGANLSNADFTNANMTNANIDGADLTNVTFTIPQKLQLLKNKNNRNRSEIQVSQVVGSTLFQVLSAGSAVRDVPNVANATFKVMLPSTSFVASDTIIDIILDTDNYAYFYFPIGENEYFRIQGVIYYISGSTVRNYATGQAVENTNYGIKAIRLLAGSLTIIVNSQNTLASSSFVVPSMKQNTDASFSPTTLPTSNSAAPIVYSSSNTNIATINSSTGVITLVADACGFVRFTASQVATETHESASITSNELFVNKQVDFTLPGLNQTFSLSTLAFLDASSVGIGSTDATAVFYVRLSDMTNLFQYQTDAFDVNNTDASDIKYYVFHRTIPTAFHINPSHAMMNKTESAGMLGTGVQEIVAAKSLVKHDFIRYIALRLFNTHYGVDLFENEKELQENITYLGETVQHNINAILSGISTTSANESMLYDASGNKYLTNDASGNTNLCRELMRQIAAAEGSRFYNNGADTATSGLRPMPLHEDDSINFKLTITAAEGQNIVTGVSVIPSRTYTIKLVLKNTVNTTSGNTNTPVTDSEMYPNSYPYSTAITTYAPTADSSGVYNVYSPPAPIPTARFGYNGWYYANTTSWVNVAQSVRDRVKWVVPSNSVGSSTVGDLRYIRMNLKVFNKTSLPFLVVTTQAGSSRRYTISAPNSLTNGTVYSFYMNFNSYAREPATIGATNAELTYSNVGSGSFANGEVITSISIETDSNAAASSIEFTLSSVVVGEVGGENEYGFSANV